MVPAHNKAFSHRGSMIRGVVNGATGALVHSNVYLTGFSRGRQLPNYVHRRYLSSELKILNIRVLFCTTITMYIIDFYCIFMNQLFLFSCTNDIPKLLSIH